MGFRFRRSLKLFPGVRLNVGLGGASLSLGGRGATMNVSKRGARNTFGIPGTGLSWTSTTSTGSLGVPGPSAQATSRRGLNAAYRRAAEETERTAALTEVAQAEEQRLELLNCWRAMAPLPPWEFYTSQCKMVQFRVC